jgi:drug/metabolite transporter (DMT)-like permease
MAGITGLSDFRGGEIIILGSLVLFTIFTRNTVSRFQNVSDLTKGAATTAAAGLIMSIIITSVWASGLVTFRYDFNPRDLGLLLWIGGISAGISMVLWFMGGRLLGVTIAAMHQNAVPFHVMMVMFLLGGGFVFDRLIAAAMVVFGVVLAQWSVKKTPRHP